MRWILGKRRRSTSSNPSSGPSPSQLQIQSQPLDPITIQSIIQNLPVSALSFPWPNPPSNTVRFNPDPEPPTDVVPGPIIGWRGWDIYDDRLISSGSTVWDPGFQKEAVCRANLMGREPLNVHRHSMQSPARRCTCGIYARKNIEGYDRYRVFGRVALWGHCIEHDTGYRARYAYPVELWILFASPMPGFPTKPVERLAEWLAETYGIPVHVGHPLRPG